MLIQSLRNLFHKRPVRITAAIVAVTLVVAWGSYLRFRGLATQGLSQYDEGWLREDALTGAKSLQQGHFHYVSFKGAPTTWLIGTLATYWGGTSQFALLFPFALLSCLGLLTQYCWGRSMYGHWTGLCAALLLATSPLHVLYSRLATTDATVMFCFPLALWVYGAAQKDRPRRSGWLLTLLAGFLAGVSWTTNYRGAMGIAILGVAELYLTAFRRGWRRIPDSLLRWLLLVVGCAIPIATWQFVTVHFSPESLNYLSGFLNVRDRTNQPQAFGTGTISGSSKVQYLLNLLKGDQHGHQLREPWFYVRALWVLENPFVVAGIALFFILWVARLAGWLLPVEDTLLGLYFAAPFVFGIMVPMKGPRLLSPVFAAFSLMAARVYLYFSHYEGRPPWLRSCFRGAGIIILLAAAGWGSLLSLQPTVAPAYNGLRNALVKIRDRGGCALGRLDNLCTAIAAADKACYKPMLGTLEDLAERQTTKDYYLLWDEQVDGDPSSVTLLRSAVDGAPPDWVEPDPSRARPWFYMEHCQFNGLSYDDSLELLRQRTLYWGPGIPVFRLRGQFTALPAGWQVKSGTWHRFGSGFSHLATDDPLGTEPVRLDSNTHFADGIVQVSLLAWEAYGGVCARANPNGPEAYYLLLRLASRNKGVLGLYRRDADGLRLLCPRRKGPVDPGTAIRLQCRGDRLIAFVAGQPALQAVDPDPLPAGVAGLIASPTQPFHGFGFVARPR